MDFLSPSGKLLPLLLLVLILSIAFALVTHKVAWVRVKRRIGLDNAGFPKQDPRYTALTKKVNRWIRASTWGWRAAIISAISMVVVAIIKYT